MAVISAFVLACAWHPFLCHSSAAAPFLRAVDAEVQDERIRAVMVVFAAHESGMTPDPAPQSWDSKSGVSCSYLQQRCDRVRGRSAREQVRMWLADVQRGGLPGICGEGPAARRIAWRRASEAQRLLEFARASSS